MKPFIRVLFITLTAFIFSQFGASMAEETAPNSGHLMARERTKAAEKEYQAEIKKRYPSPTFWGEQVVYQIQVDRFNNGDFSNDLENLEDNQISEMRGLDYFGIADYRHGGDLQGIIDRLDYLKELGVSTLWITPVFKHTGSYHGYCTADFGQVDPGFGTNQLLRKLVQESHQRDIKVVLDIVVNHMCDRQTSYSKMPDHYSCSDELNLKNWLGQSGGSRFQGELNFSESFYSPLKNKNYFNRCGANSQSDMEGVGAAAVYGDFVNGMYDFDTRNYDFQEIFTELHKYWIAYADIDGYRMDAVKHVSEDFIAYFSTQIRKYASSIGKKNFFIIGEVAGPSDWIGRRLGKMYSNPENPNDRGHVPQGLTNRLWTLREDYLGHPISPYPGLNASYDFAHGGIARDVLQNKKSPLELENHFRGSYYNDIAAQNDYRLSWNLLEIHDWPRFAGVNSTSLEKSRIGLAYLALSEGTPIIYYGQEQGFNGDCHFDSMDVGAAKESLKELCKGHSHALFRQDMFSQGWFKLGSTVPEINALAKIARPANSASNKKKISWQKDPFLNRSHDVFLTTKKLLQIRQSCNGLKFGSTKFRWGDSSREGILAFSRIDPNGHEVLVVMNTAWENKEIPVVEIRDFRQGAKWVNLLNTKENAWTTGAGKLDFSGLKLKGNSQMVFVPEENIGSFSSSSETYTCRN